MRAVLRKLLIRFPRLRKLANGPLGRLARSYIPSPPVISPDYEQFRHDRIVDRSALFTAEQQVGLLSFITTVWNTDPGFIRELADSVFGQKGGANFEWFILDNGSKDQGTINCLQELAKHPCVRLERVAENLGIVGGMRYCLERASNRYVLPLDSDDWLYPDCVAIFTSFIVARKFPAIIYSDEDKIENGIFRDPYFKPDWDPVLFVHSCYIAHLCAIDRVLALEYEAYSDPRCEGCHDWDTFMRFLVKGHRPAHIAEVVYGWRMHALSTAGNIYSKPVVYESHQAVLQKFIDCAPFPNRFTLEKSPLFGGTPDWWIKRAHVSPRPMVTVLMCSGSTSNPRCEFHVGDYNGHSSHVVPLASAMVEIAKVAEIVHKAKGLVHLLWDQVSLKGAEWPWEALGLMELFPDVVMVGGRVCSRQHRILAAGSYFGFGDGCDTPDRDRMLGDPGYFAQMWKQRSVSAVSSQNAIVDAGFLFEALQSFRQNRYPVSAQYLGAWLGAHAERNQHRVVYSPFLEGVANSDWDVLVSPAERKAFVRENLKLIPETGLMSPRLGLNRSSAYKPVPRLVRTLHLQALGVNVSGRHADDL